MKKIMLALFLIAGIATLANAQDTIKTKRTPEERAARMGQMLQKKLNLTADQATKVNAILTEQATKTSGMKMKGVKGGGLARMEAKAEADKKINAILTPEQQKEYAQIEEKAKEKALARKKNNTAPTEPAQ